MAKLKFAVKTVYFPFLFVCGILIGTMVLSGMQNGMVKDVCLIDGVKGTISVSERSEGTTEFPMEIENRKQSVDELCTRFENMTYYRDVREHLLYNIETNVMFCFVPKVASTLWKTIFHALDQSSEVSQADLGHEIVHMRKSYIHTVRLPWIPQIKPFSVLFSFLHSATRVMFTRDPYSRLFSAYVDKLMLPSFWKPVGMTIVKTLRHNPHPESLLCGHDVTFEEFLRHVVEVMTDPGLIKFGVDDHWIPVSWICQPCHMNYDFIGKIETFAKDRDVVLGDVMGLTDTVQYLHTHQAAAENSLNMAINTSWFATVNFKKCVSKVDIMIRLWQSFQIQGHLPMSLTLPLDVLKHVGTTAETKEVFRKHVLQAHQQYGLNHEESTKQRRLAMANAYQSINTDVKRNIVERFKEDFEIFGYDENPSDFYEPGFQASEP